jgi:uncharacterized protein (DUF58 family)
MALFESDFLQRLEYLSLISRRVFRGQLLAQRRTMQLGAGLEFADHRDYVAGDDLRYLDWSIFARHDELLLKRFQDEEDLHVYFLLDASRSMQAGAKFNLARQVTAALAYVAMADLDRVAVVACADRVIADFPLTRGKGRILGLMKFLEGLAAIGDATDLARVASSFVHRNQRRGLVVVVSDLFDPAGFEKGLDLLRHHRYEPHIVQLFDPAEADPKLLGEVELEDVETGELRQVIIAERSLKEYRRLFAEFQQRLARYAAAYGIGCTRSPSNIPFDELVLGMMRKVGSVA